MKATLIIYAKEFKRYICVWLLFPVAIFVVFWIYTPGIHIQCNFSEDVCHTINTIGLSLSLSYIAGFIFFFLSEFIPTAKKKYEDECRVVACLNHLTQEFNGLFNFSSNKDNYQRLPFVELSQSLFQEDVSKYCKSLLLTDENGECDIDVHFKPEVLFYLELNVQSIREDLNIIQMLSHNLPFPVVYNVGFIKNSRILSYIESRRGYKATFSPEDLSIRFALYKHMMNNYYNDEKELMKITNEYNKIYTCYKIWRSPQDLEPETCFD